MSKAWELNKKNIQTFKQIEKLKEELNIPLEELPKFVLEKKDIKIQMTQGGGISIETEGTDLDFSESQKLADWFKRNY